MTILAAVWLIMKMIATFFLIMFSMIFILDPIHAIREVSRTLGSWKAAYLMVKLTIENKILHYKLNKARSSQEPYVHVIRRAVRV